MRYLIQLLIPALIVIAVIFVLLRGRPGASTDVDARNRDNGDRGMVIAIIVIGALVAIAVVVAMQNVWSAGQ